jgi:hypothetical protein
MRECEEEEPMKAVVCQNGELGVVDRPAPVPGPGQPRILNDPATSASSPRSPS